MEASDLITKRISELADWRGKVFAQVRKIVHEAAPDIVEEWKWDTPVNVRQFNSGNVLLSYQPVRGQV